MLLFSQHRVDSYRPADTLLGLRPMRKQLQFPPSLGEETKIKCHRTKITVTGHGDRGEESQLCVSAFVPGYSHPESSAEGLLEGMGRRFSLKLRSE